MIGMRVKWTTIDTLRAHEEHELYIAKKRHEFSNNRAAAYLYRSFEDWLGSQPRTEPEEYVTVHRGRVLAVAFQPEQVAVAKSDRNGTIEKTVKPRWTALVAREDGRVVELNPLELTEDTSSPFVG